MSVRQRLLDRRGQTALIPAIILGAALSASSIGFLIFTRTSVRRSELSAVKSSATRGMHLGIETLSGLLQDYSEPTNRYAIDRNVARNAGNPLLEGPTTWTSVPADSGASGPYRWIFNVGSLTMSTMSCNPSALAQFAMVGTQNMWDAAMAGNVPTSTACSSAVRWVTGTTAFSAPIVNTWGQPGNPRFYSGYVDVSSKSSVSTDKDGHQQGFKLGARVSLPPPAARCTFMVADWETKHTKGSSYPESEEPYTVTYATNYGVANTAGEWLTNGVPDGVAAAPVGGTRSFSFRDVWAPGKAPVTRLHSVHLYGYGPREVTCSLAVTVGVEPPCPFMNEWHKIALNFWGGVIHYGRNVTEPSNPFPGDIHTSLGGLGGAYYDGEDFHSCDGNMMCIGSNARTIANAGGLFGELHNVIYSYVAPANSPSCTPVLFPRPEGCFAPGVRLRMADGSLRYVDSLRQGDLVWNPVLHRAQGIARVIEGPERKPLFELLAADEEPLVVTTEHPMWTRRGLIRALDLRAEDELRGGDGAFHRLVARRALPVKPDQHVWNVELAAENGLPEAHAVLAEGLITGDLTTQKQLRPRKR